MKNTFEEAVYYYTPAPTGMPEPLKLLLARLGMRFQLIKPEEAGQTIGYLTSIDGFVQLPGNTAAPPVTEEVLLLKNFTSERLDALLAGMRKTGLPPIQLKAVVTEHNVGWTFASLAEELRREHNAINQARTQGNS